MPLIDPLDGVHTPGPQFALDLISGLSDAIDAWATVPGWLSRACVYAFGTDPISWAEQRIGGDWRAVSTAGDMFTQFGDWFAAARNNAGEIAWAVMDEWQGNAALAAKDQFLAAQAQLDDWPEAALAMGRATQRVASEVWMVTTAVNEVLTQVITWAVVAIVPPTALTLIPKLLTLCLDVIGLVGVLLGLLAATIAGLAGATARLGGLPVPRLGTGYDNPLHA